MSVGKITNSAISAVNENTLALVNINLDFSLWRCNPLPEFLPVGSALTTGRRREAETGQTHRTASKLGFLFNEVIPDVPQLIQAYGCRVSNILSRPEVNPQGTESDGPFQSFIGADCTSIWAAATSGSSSICVHLLACMLADVWDAKTATSIWVELIENRKRRIQADVERGKIVNPHAYLAAQQLYARDELASWDASARSWLRRAGESMKFERTQLTLITNNVAIPYPRDASMYENVIATWTRGMEVLERLLHGLPQQACDRAVFRGISAWHMYPDLLVFQVEETKISFKDQLFSPSAILTVGLEYKCQPSDNFIRWSLALSHLKYYGDPVPVRSNEDLSRIQMSQLWLVALGAVFRQWDIPYVSFDVGMRWFEELGKKLRHKLVCQSPQLSWLVQLCSAATDLEGENRRVARMLVNYGWRRGNIFLGKDTHQDRGLCFFGLGSSSVMHALSHESEIDSGFSYLRHVCCSLQLEPEDAVIAFNTTLGGQDYSEWATIRPVHENLGGRGEEPQIQSPGVRNVRWLHIEIPDDTYSLDLIEIRRHLERRRTQIEAAGERCIIVTQKEYMLTEHRNVRNALDLLWERPPKLFSGSVPVEFRHVHGTWSLSTIHYDVWVRPSKHDACMKSIATLRESQLQEVVPPENALAWLVATPSEQHICEYLLAVMSRQPLEAQQSSASHGKKRKRYVGSRQETGSARIGNAAISPSDDCRSQCFSMIGARYHHPGSMSLSLRALEIASEIYRELPCATVSLQVVDLPLVEARWLPELLQSGASADLSLTNKYYRAITVPLEQLMTSLSREQSFACLAMFESGRFNIDPPLMEDVVALCSEDSIFVAKSMLSDPGGQTPTSGIRHMVGNVGQAGVVCMVSPEHPRVKRPGHNASAVSHSPYYGTLSMDGFRGTSLHLSFTNWKVPLDCGNTGEIDQEIFLLEAIVSVQEMGKWVADIDVLGVERSCPEVITCTCNALSRSEQSSRPPPAADNAVSISSWDEFLDPPPCIGVVQTNGNWVARLAAICVLIQEGNGHMAVLLKEGADRLCWDCLSRDYTYPEPHMPQRIIL